jgi:hypothetical protein
MHKTIEPSILYFGAPVGVVGTLDAGGSANIAPMSSARFGSGRKVRAPEVPVSIVSRSKCASSQ